MNAITLEQRAHTELDHHNYESAFVLAYRALSEDPESFESLQQIFEDAIHSITLWDDVVSHKGELFHVLDILTEKESGNAERYVQRAYVEILSEEYDLAFTHSNQALELGYEGGEPYHFILIVMIHRKEFQEAVDMSRTLTKNCGFPTWNNLAVAHYRLGKIEQARLLVQTAIDRNTQLERESSANKGKDESELEIEEYLVKNKKVIEKRGNAEDLELAY